MIGLCVEVEEIKQKNVVGRDKNVVDEKVATEACDEHVEEDEEDNCRFDYCDDPDGASSDDDEYGRCGRFTDDEEPRENLPHKKRGLSSIPEFVKLEMRLVDLAVGQCYDTKEDLEMRLQILSVAQQFDYNVGYTTPMLLTIYFQHGGRFIINTIVD
ncbi:unnamed protein product [Arabis nemorensis]|uniref:Uncharacterized protein n=1 Tax=Arabis nemorensis TaxID=586526 RepID=A0A565BM71_9BRAS|nr:unnamed protein product [Arabis nemorensis]